ncbi:MAG: hypothetical protein PHP31_08970 [Lentimicrobiaceae bacterium]|nr:hypothetical protein [Lentimicrobiaceae bacterium]
MDIENYIKQEIENAKVSVAIDWLTVYYTFDILKLQALVKDDELTTSLTDDLYILKTEVGTQHFEKRTKVYFKNNEVATLMYQSRSELIYKSNIAKVDYKNSILYSLEFLDVHNELLKFGFKFSSFGRVDIAVDGCNYLVKFLNMYVKENAKMTESLTGYRMINSNYKRNVLNAGIYNPKIKRHEHFRIGSNLSKKYLTIYNKSYEITGYKTKCNK